MDTTRLRYFCTIAKVGSLTKAAELLGVSSAALSKSVRLLEEETKAQLIVQSGRGINITLEGRLLAARAEEILIQLENLKSSLKSKITDEGFLRIGSFEVFTTFFLGPVIKKYFPRHVVSLYELTPGHLEQAIFEGKIDYGITYIPTQAPGVDHALITKIEMGVFALDKNLGGDKFENVPFVVPIIPLHGSPNKVEGLDGWPDAKLARTIQYRVTLVESALELCRQGLAAAYLPRFIIKLHNERVQPSLALAPLSSAPIPEVLLQPVYLASRNGEGDTLVARNLARALRLICA